MCLETIKYKVKEYTGFKFFLHNSIDESYKGMYSVNFDEYRRGQWLNANSSITLIAENTKDTYSSGFHIFPTIHAAKRYLRANDFLHRLMSSERPLVIAKVSYRGILARGTDGSSWDVGQAKIPCVVAMQMRIETHARHEDFDAFFADHLPKPRRRSISAVELNAIFNAGGGLDYVTEQITNALGYDFVHDFKLRKLKLEK